MPYTNDPDQQFAKTTLFCPACEHASPIDGDWIMDDSVQRDRLLCPRCGTDIVDQPQL
jgi:ribosomal protein S27AE